MRVIDCPWLRRLLTGILLIAAAPAAEAQLAVTKTHVDENGPPLCEGDTLLFTIHIEAIGGSTFRLIDPIAASFYSSWATVLTHGTACSSNEGPLMPTGPNGTFCADRVTMSPGDQLDFQYRTTMRNNQSSRQHCATAIARVSAAEEYRSTDCVNYDCPFQGADVTLVKTYTGPAQPAVGDPVSWRVEVHSIGSTGDTNVHVADAIDTSRIAAPAFANYSRAPNQVGPGFEVKWNTIGIGEVLSFDVTGVYANCTPGPPEPVCNQAAVDSDGIRAQGDPERLSSITLFGPPAPACVDAVPGGAHDVASPIKTAVDLTGLPTRFGHVIEYTITIENNALCPAPAASFTDTLPASLPLDLASVTIDPPGAGVDQSAGNTVLVDAIALGPSAVVTLRFHATVGVMSGRICNTGTVTVDSVQLPTSTACINVQSPDPVTITKQHDDPNADQTLQTAQQLVYTIHIVNNGRAEATDIHVLDPLPAGVSIVTINQSAGGNVIQAGPSAVEIDSIRVLPGPANGVDVIFTVAEDGTQPQGTQVCNVATLYTANNPSGAADTDPACVTIVTDGVTMAKRHDDPNGDGSIQPGQTLHYTVTLRNRRPTTLTDVHLLDVLPTGVSFVSLDQDAGGTVLQAGPGAVEIDGITLMPGAVNARDVVFTVVEDGAAPGGGDICNVATVTTAANPGPVDTNPACVRLPPSCPVPPGRILPLLAARRDVDVVLSWQPDPSSARGYRVYSVADKQSLDQANTVGMMRCSSPDVGTTTCTVPAAIPGADELLQVVGVCADGTEGAVN